MKKRWTLGVVLGLAIPLIALTTPARGQDEKPQYVGVQSCAKICHKTAKQGEQLKIWEESKHAQAYALLTSDKGKEFAKAAGVADPTKDAKCINCHTSAGSAEAAMLADTYSAEDGVGCEACHGPGSMYKKRSIMKDVELAKTNGLVIPNAETCAKCHSQAESNPHKQKAFNFEERVKVIAHAKPAE
jgi:predicted CXXCH cytochrome family protein